MAYKPSPVFSINLGDQMNSVYNSVLKVIGKTRDDPAFGNLSTLLGVKPFQYGDSKFDVWYFFEGHGLHIAFLKETGLFAAAHFLRGVTDRRGYSGDLPNGVNWGDMPEVVETRMAAGPCSSRFETTPKPAYHDEKTLVEAYETPEVRLEFGYDITGLYSLRILHWSTFTILGYAEDYGIVSANTVVANRAQWLASRHHEVVQNRLCSTC